MTRSMIVAVVLSVIVGVPAGVSQAQQPPEASDGTFVIQLVDLDPSNPRRVRFRTDQGQLTASVSGQICSVVDASTPSPPVIVLGSPNQPEACGLEGGVVTLTNERGVELVEKFTVVRGEVVHLGNYGPVPADGGSGLGAASTGAGPATTAREGSRGLLASLFLGALAVVAAATGRALSRREAS